MIHLTPEALEFISHHGKSALLINTKRTGGCCGVIDDLCVQLGLPVFEEIDRHVCLQYGDVSLYVPRVSQTLSALWCAGFFGADTLPSTARWLFGKDFY